MLLVAFLLAVLPAAASGLGWADLGWVGYDEALAQARAKGRPVAVIVYADWCGTCAEFAQKLSGPEARAITERVVLTRLDQDRQAALVARLPRDRGYVPRIYFLDAGGRELPVRSSNPTFPRFYYTDGTVAEFAAACDRAVQALRTGSPPARRR